MVKVAIFSSGLLHVSLFREVGPRLTPALGRPIWVVTLIIVLYRLALTMNSMGRQFHLNILFPVLFIAIDMGIICGRMIGLHCL